MHPKEPYVCTQHLVMAIQMTPSTNIWTWYTLKRALHTPKRAQHTFKRALHAPKRALRLYLASRDGYPNDIFHQRMDVVYAAKSPIHTQKSPMYIQKSPTFVSSNTQRLCKWHLPPMHGRGLHTYEKKEPYIHTKEPYINPKEPYICI